MQEMGYIEMRVKCLRIVVIVLLCVLVDSCQKKEDSSADEVVTFGVVGKTVTPVNIERKLFAAAMIDSSVVAGVTSEMSGRLRALKVRKGDSVRKGQLLGIVDASKAGSTFLASPLTAPVSGQVSDILAEIGNEVGAGKKIIEIIDNEKLELSISVSETDVPFITKNSRGKLRFSTMSQENESVLENSFDVRVLAVNKVFSDKSSTMHVTVALAQLAPHIKSGMVGELSLVLEERKNAMAIPKNIIVQRLVDDAFAYGVFVVHDIVEDTGDVLFRPVQLGIESNDGGVDQTLVEVVDGLLENEVVVVEGHNALADKVKARIFAIDGIPPSKK